MVSVFTLLPCVNGESDLVPGGFLCVELFVQFMRLVPNPARATTRPM